MLFSVGDSGAPLGGGAGVVVAVVVVVVVLLVVGAWLPLVPQAVVNAPIAMSTAPPARASRRRSTLRAFMRNSYLRVNFPARNIRAAIGSACCHQWSNTVRGQWPIAADASGTAQRPAVRRTTILSCLVPQGAIAQ
jgi:hypothetical protein